MKIRDALLISLRRGSKRLGPYRRPELFYVAPGVNWAVDWVGHYVTRGIREQFAWGTHLVSTPRFLVGEVVHYGSLWPFLDRIGRAENERNKVVVTVFHGDRSPEFPELRRAMDRLLENATLAARILTVCQIMERRLLRWGIPREKVVRLPLGVDTHLFRPATDAARRAQRIRLGIPDDAFCIGSFHKDGVGWKEGFTPKLSKGPDLLVEVLAQLHREFPIFVLLTAPARGYVRQGLEGEGVPYRHVVLEDFREIAGLYGSLDAYLVTSREEGGPQGVLEALACGVPVVSTRVGLVPDVIKHGSNGLLSAPGDLGSLLENTARLIAEPELRSSLAAQTTGAVKAYDWSDISARYYRELYLPLLRELTEPCGRSRDSTASWPPWARRSPGRTSDRPRR